MMAGVCRQAKRLLVWLVGLAVLAGAGWLAFAGPPL
jgi:hypothetical protein